MYVSRYDQETNRWIRIRIAYRYQPRKISVMKSKDGHMAMYQHQVSPNIFERCEQKGSWVHPRPYLLDIRNASCSKLPAHLTSPHLPRGSTWPKDSGADGSIIGWHLRDGWQSGSLQGPNISALSSLQVEEISWTCYSRWILKCKLTIMTKSMHNQLRWRLLLPCQMIGSAFSSKFREPQHALSAKKTPEQPSWGRQGGWEIHHGQGYAAAFRLYGRALHFFSFEPYPE